MVIKMAAEIHREVSVQTNGENYIDVLNMRRWKRDVENNCRVSLEDKLEALQIEIEEIGDQKDEVVCSAYLPSDSRIVMSIFNRFFDDRLNRLSKNRFFFRFSVIRF